MLILEKQNVSIALFNFAVENDARKVIEMFCISKINIVGSNFHAQTLFVLGEQSFV